MEPLKKLVGTGKDIKNGDTVVYIQMVAGMRGIFEGKVIDVDYLNIFVAPLLDTPPKYLVLNMPAKYLVFDRENLKSKPNSLSDADGKQKIVGLVRMMPLEPETPGKQIDMKGREVW